LPSATLGGATTGTETATGDADEACDDGNASEIDGCTSSCEIGPIDVLPTGATNTDAVSFAAGLTAIDVDCPDGSVIVGADVFTSKVAIGFQFHCAPLGLADSNPTSITMGPASLQPPAGNAGGSTPSVCPVGEMFGAIDLAVSGSYLVGMAVTCRVLDVEGTGPDQTLVPLEGSAVPFQGGGSPNQQIGCPTPMVAVGMRVSIDGSNIPRGLGIRCRAMELVYP
jgi:cysteine-rich repeat protein